MRYIFDDQPDQVIKFKRERDGDWTLDEEVLLAPSSLRCARCKGTGDCGGCRGEGTEPDGLRPCRECHGAEFCMPCKGEGVTDGS